LRWINKLQEIRKFDFIHFFKKKNDYITLQISPWNFAENLQCHHTISHYLCCAAWGASSKVGIKRLNNLINRAKRLIDSNAILSLDKIHERFCLIKLFKYFIRKDSNYFYQKFDSNIPNHAIRTRSNVNNLFTNPRVISSKYKSSFFYQSCKYWNKLPNNIRNIKKVAKFKQMLKNRT